MKFAAFILLIFSSVTSFAQLSIEGQVIDGETNTPLVGANVFIANTTKGVSTDNEGKFRIEGLLPAHYQLVVSFVGYKTQAVDILPKQKVIYKILLQPNVQTLGEVVVRAGKSSRIKQATYLRSFKEHFIGKSDNSLGCRLENPGVLTLEKEGDVLTAENDSALVLVNKGLGYRIKIFLKMYRYNSIRDALHYEGHMMYEQLLPKNESQKRRWAKNRLRAYYGSEMHFLRSLYNHRAHQEGYYFYFVSPFESDTVVKAKSRLFNNRRIKVPSISDERIIDSVLSTKDAPVLKFSGPIEINYLNEGESVVFQRAMKVRIRKSIQVSRMKVNSPAVILPDGRISPVSAVEIGGYWSFELVSESLPLDYQPEEDLKITKGKY